jgi:hypothetical protein
MKVGFFCELTFCVSLSVFLSIRKSFLHRKMADSEFSDYESEGCAPKKFFDPIIEKVIHLIEFNRIKHSKPMLLGAHCVYCCLHT